MTLCGSALIVIERDAVNGYVDLQRLAESSSPSPGGYAMQLAQALIGLSFRLSDRAPFSFQFFSAFKI